LSFQDAISKCHRNYIFKNFENNSNGTYKGKKIMNSNGNSNGEKHSKIDY